MKMNVFVTNDAGGRRALGFVEDPEDDLIQSIDEEGMPSDELLATRLIAFLADRGLTADDAIKLSLVEQQRLKKEFLENN
jgi:hypothetical protein